MIHTAIKTISKTDASKGAYVPDWDQQMILEMAGYSPVLSTDNRTIQILNARTGLEMRCSYYNAIRQDGRGPESRLGREIIHELVVGHVGKSLSLAFDGHRLTASHADAIQATRGDLSPIPDDPNERQMFARRIRAGQPEFRKIQMSLWNGCCAISGHGPADALDAAHIQPHALSGINDPDNGLLLRSDIHNLFDKGLIEIVQTSDGPFIRVDKRLEDEPYMQFDGQKLRVRTDGKQLPSTYFR